MRLVENEERLKMKVDMSPKAVTARLKIMDEL
jgi:hypothetical protein